MKKFLKLINDERKEKGILSATACGPGATDTCYTKDYGACSGKGTQDICLAADWIGCTGGALDRCGTDWDTCSAGSDYCSACDSD